MKIYYNVGNLDACKLFLASELTACQINRILVGYGEKFSPQFTVLSLPVLEVAAQMYNFGSNESCRYIWMLQKGIEEKSETIDRVCSWETSELKPLVKRLAFCTEVETKDVLASIRHLLTNIPEEIKPYVTIGPEPQAASVILWCSLYLLLSSISPFQDLRSVNTQLTEWFDELSARPVFESCLSAILPETKWEALCDALSSQLTLTHKEKNCGEKSVTEKTNHCSVTDKESAVTNAVSIEDVASAETAFLHGASSAPLRKERSTPILPEPGARNILITSALPYVNNVPHLGNIIGCVLSADVYARFCRLRGHNALYICGTDEYGTATETKALEEGLTPQQICDKYNAIHSDIYSWFNISFDFFGRTTTPHQTKIAQDIFWDLYNNDFIIKDDVEQLLCEKCNRFLADRFVEGTCPFCAADDARGDQCDKCGKLINAVELKQPKCKICRMTPVIKSSSHLFVDLPKLEPRLNEHLDKAFETGLWTSNAKMITRSWIRDGLKPRCISRDLKWGTPVPLEGYQDKVFYVWFDAPIGYISITANYTEEWEKWWKNPSEVQLYNFMAKDNVPFHSVIFPCSLLGTGQPWTVVNHMSATEYLNYEDGKFSKSRNLGVFGDNARDAGIPADVFRFYLLYVRPESQDSAFSWDDLMMKNNGELLNNLGNFVNRSLAFVAKNLGGKISRITLNEDDRKLVAEVARELKKYIDNLEQIKIRDGLRNILAISTLGNQYIQANTPWVLVKGSDSERERAGSVLSLAVNIVCLLSRLVSPYMPGVSETIESQMNFKPHQHLLTEQFISVIPEGHQIGDPQPLFQKLEKDFISNLQARFGGKGTKEKVEKAADSSSKKSEGSAAGDVQPVTVADPETIARLTAEVAQQGEVVRKLKSEKAAKSLVDPEVAKLLALKEQLAAAEGKPSTSNNQKKKKGKK